MSKGDFESKRVLVVEDDRVLRKVVVDHLKLDGFTVIEAEDGAAGLSLALSEHPDVTLLDVVMPKMDGMTVLEKIRESDWGKNAKIIMLTNLSDSEKIAHAAEKGVSDYLVKADWDIESIIEKVKEKAR